MKIKMKKSADGSANAEGSIGQVYESGKVYDMNEPWQMKIATTFLNNGSADKAKEVTEKKVITKVEKKSFAKKIFSKKKK
jgi:hypothetical protein